jgi:C-terminal processing protease CtpA/Prc
MPQHTDSRGNDSKWPPMSPAEMVAEIDRIFGPATSLRNVREELPSARHRPSEPSAALEASRGLRSPAGVGLGARAGVGSSAGVLVGTVLEPSQRLIVIDQALFMLETLYAHLPLKKALHAIDPIQRLRLLRLRHESLDEREFQSEMIDIFVGLRDLHTNYILPTAYHRKFAFLPFRIEEFYDDGERKYLVSWVSPRNTSSLEPGVEVTHWNGMPIDLAVARNASHEAGSNPEARRAQGLEALTLRWFGMSLPPDEDWVVLTYVDANGATQETRFEWAVVEPDELRQLRGTGSARASAEQRARIGVDVRTELLRRVRKALFDPSAVKAESEMAAYRRGRDVAGRSRASAARRAPLKPARAELSVLPDVYPRFGAVTTPSGVFGYVRLATFSPEDPNINPGTLIDMAVDEFVRILRTLPPSGLILDVRGNGGGYVNFGERILQTLSPQPITPEPFHFVASALTLQLAGAEPWLGAWEEPLKTALSTGAGFSQGFPLTDPAECNDIGQVYQGPVVLITDALCYSTTDIFAAGFQDHDLGTILGVHDNTGAGGANVWDHTDVLQQLNLAPNPFVELPGGASMRVAARRSTRVGAQSGVPLEDLGVVPHERYFMTRNDLLNRNADLIAHAAAILKGKDKQTLQIAAVGDAPFHQVTVTSSKIDRADVYVNGRPVASTDLALSSGSATIDLPTAAKADSRVEAFGYRKGRLVVSTRLTPSDPADS